MIIEESKEEKNFITELIKAIREINTSNLSNINSLENVVQFLAYTMKRIDDNCNRDLEKYRLTKYIEHWKQFKKTVKSTKYVFFDLKIQEIANKRQGLWELMNWVNKHKLLTIKAIKYNGCPCLKIKDLW